MPKFNKKEQQQPLVEAAPVAMDREETGNLGDPIKPKFDPLTAFEQNGKKVEFRRVRYHALEPSSCQPSSGQTHC